jgi:GT2 family glycosyltransferase
MDALRIVGLFDDSFFAYCEDTDMGLRLRWAGFKAVVTPGAEVTHYYSMTAGKFSLKKVFWVERNHFWVVIKNFPVVLLLLVPFATFWRYLVQAYTILSRSGDLDGFTDETSLSQIIMTIIKAHVSALAGAPLMFRKRVAFLPKRKLNDFQMLKLIWIFKMSMVEIIIGTKNAGK